MRVRYGAVQRLLRPGDGAARFQQGNDIPAALADELTEILASREGVRFERIVSRGHTSPRDFWYDQDEHELVIVIDGAARLIVEGAEPIDLTPGDWLVLAPHVRHHVDWTDPNCDTIWLAAFYR